MGVFILRRTAFAVVTIFVASVLIFCGIRLAGGNIAEVMLGPGATPRGIKLLEQQYGLDRPLISQYGSWLWAMLSGNLGTALQSGQSVGSLVAGALPVTLPLACGGMLVALLIGIPAGTYAAARAGHWSASAFTVVAQLGIAVPSFWAGLLLALLFGVKLQWLPTGGWTPWSVSPVEAFRSLILPSLALGVVTGAALSRYVRTAVLDVMGEDFVRTARASGMTRGRAIVSVGLRNALLPLVTVWGLIVTDLVAGAVIVEQVFSLPGLGNLMLSAIQSRDVITVQSTVTLVVVFVVIVNLVIDLLYGVLDPRVRSSAR